MSKVSTKLPASKRHASSQARSFTLQSYNVNFGSFCGNDIPPHEAWKVYGAILEADADIVCLQETNVGWENFLKGRLLSQYPNQKWLNPSSLGSNYLACGSALLTKQDCLIKWAKPVRVSNEGSFFPQMVAMVDLGPTRGSDVVLVNVHLRPPLAMGDYLTEPTSTYSFRGIKRLVSEVGAHAWAYLYEAGHVHVQELRHLLLPAVLAGDALPSDSVAKSSSARAAPVFVVGDFNEGHWGAGCRHMLSAGYADALCNQTTWHWPLFGGRVVLKGAYDHIFYKKAGPWKLSSARVMTQYLHMSDHLPVVANFSLV